MIEASLFFLGIILGVLIGQFYEDHYGKTGKQAKKYHAALLRMIPILKRHYTGDYIYWNLLEGRRYDDSE